MSNLTLYWICAESVENITETELHILSSEQKDSKLQFPGMLYIMAFSPTHGFDINVGHVTFKLS